MLPLDSDGEDPDDDSPHAVQHHPGGGAHLLRHADTRKVEERDTNNVTYRETVELK